jgi:Uma2 family endonuclease
MSPLTISPRQDPIRIPAQTSTLDGFRRWARSPDFPAAGRIDYLAGDLEVEMSPEDLYTHGAPKAEIAAALQELVARAGRGAVFVDRARVTVVGGDLSTEPDVTVVLWETLESGRVREVSTVQGEPGRFAELLGPPDLIVEVISDGSVQKDRTRLPELYGRGGVPELWLVDARGPTVDLEIHTLVAGRYRPSPPSGGWQLSPLLDRGVRLTRSAVHDSRWTYRLETRAIAGG